MKLIPRYQLTKLGYEEFEKHFQKLLRNDEYNKFAEWRRNVNRRKLAPEDFVKNYFDLMRKVDYRLAFDIFPHFSRTLTS